VTVTTFSDFDHPETGPGVPRADHSEATRGVTTARLFEAIAAATEDGERRRLQDQVVVCNMGVARAIAARYRGRGISDDDLVQAACVGLVKAVQGFDLSFERDFLSYAVPTITGEVRRYFRDCGWAIRPPRRVQELQSQISRASAELAQELHRSPRPSEIAHRVDADPELVVEALAADGCFAPTSLDVEVGEDGATYLGDLLGEDDAELERAEARVVLGPEVRRLAPRDRRILELRFFHGWTQDQIAREIGVTQMQVSRLLSRILADLRGRLA
jgi:RNA polymerase sigma-B factor